MGNKYQDGKRTKGTDTFYFINHYKLPKHKAKDITFDQVVRTTREVKKHKHRTRMIVGGNKIKHYGDAGTPAAHLEITKLLFNRVLSRRKSKFMKIDIANFYLMTPMDNY